MAAEDRPFQCGGIPFEEARRIGRGLRMAPMLYERLCQLSRHNGEAGSMGRSDLGDAVAIRPINWVNCA